MSQKADSAGVQSYLNRAVSEVGDSFSVTIPDEVASSNSLEVGDEVGVRFDGLEREVVVEFDDFDEEIARAIIPRGRSLGVTLPKDPVVAAGHGPSDHLSEHYVPLEGRIRIPL
jgi:hypothetical protein